MGTKRPSWTLFDTQPNQNKAVLPHQSDARISGEPSQRTPGTTGPSDRGRGRLREEERRGARESERMNPRNKRKDGEPMDWYPGREPVPGPGTRGEREWTVREREKVEEKLRNGRLVSYSEYDMDKVAKKGGTFPRMRNGSREQAKIMTALREEEMDRDRKALTERPRRTEIEREPEREGDRARRTERHGDRERYRERERDGGRPRVKDEGRPGGGRTREERPAPQRERLRDPDHSFPERRREREGDTSDLRDRREREIARERERSKLSVGDRVSKAPSPRRRDREGYFESERENWERAKTRDGKRDTKSEGDSDGGAGKRWAKDRERESHHSRSEGDTERHMRNKGRDVPRYRDDERQRHRDARQRDQAISSEKTRDLYRERDRRKERDFAEDSRRSDTTVRDRKERRPEDRQRASDERVRHRYREEEERQYRARAEEERRYRDRRERPADPRQYDPGTGNAGKPVSETPPKALPRDQSSGEWSSDLDSEIRQTWTKDSYEERESEGESTAESDRDVGRDRSRAVASRCVDELERSAERRGERTGPVPQHRRMWLEPQRRKCSKDSSLEDEFVEARTGLTDKTMGQERRSGIEGGKERGRPLEEPYRRLSDEGRQVDRPRDPKEETEGVSVDAEEFLAEREKEVMESPLSAQRRGFRDAGQGGMKDGVKQGERDPGSDCTRSESEGGSETGWDLGRDKVLSGEDGFITVSSGGDEEDEREEFEDCSEFWEDGHSYHGPQAEEMGRRNRQREDKEYVIEEEENEEEAEAAPPGTEMPPKYVFCVIGQTEPLEEHSEPSETDQLEKVEDNVPGSRLPCDVETAAQPLHDTHPVLSRTTELHDGDDQHTPDSTKRQPTEDPSPSNESSYTAESASLMDVKHRETGVRTERDPEHPYAEIRAVSRDEQTEQLLVQWRDKQSEYRGLPESSPAQEGPDRVYADTRGDVVVSQEKSVPLPTHPQTTQPEDVRPGEAEEDEEDEVSIRVRMSGAWGMEEEAKRRSQAPHLKWAKNVVRKILGSSEECGIDQDTPSSPGNLAEPTRPEVGAQAAGLEGHTKPDTTATSGDGQESLGSDHDSGPEVDEGNTEPLESEELRDEESAFSETWGEEDLRNVLDKVGRNKRNSKIFNAAQLYQQYSEEAQNIEILRQSHFTVVPVHAERPAGPLPSGPPTSAPPAPPSAPASRPLPPLPLVPHPHSLSSSLSSSRSSGSAKNLPLPETPKAEPRPPSPRLSISLGQSTSLWQDLPGVRNSTDLGQLSEDQRRLQEVRFEVVTSEASYCRSLDIVVEHFVKSKQLGVLLTTQDRSWLFSRFADVRAISHSFLSKLEEKVESDMLQFTVCDVIARHCQRFKMVYVPYLTNQSYQDATYQRLMNENQRFKRVVEKLERSPVCQRLPLRSFLILPFQRITRIKLLVQNIVKRTAPGTEEVVQAIKALKLLEKMIQESNDSISQMKSIESLVSLSAMVDFECKTLPLVSQSRRLVREGPVTELMEFSVKDTERSIYLHLFNDHLLLSLHKEGGRFTVIDHSPVSDLRAENCRVKLHSLQKNLFRLHLSQKALLLRTDTQNDKLRWISAISRPQPEVDFSAAQDFTQMQCIRAFITQQPDELSLEKADVILVHQQSGDGWVEGTKLSDRHRGWMPESHLETITNSGVCQRNLQDALKLTTATAAV
ncbi:zinc finger CCCH domain-containing protein 13 isoform X2 [Gadus morhua]|uniref:zinc finger CCCH domain-containing protein 13 isoform X2 n=1 Tax=Gadus morhua TaxID=8049 RepID=UPI0011B7527D|nr:zinc finger CCCH domain-containing protein 13-like isoform X2 [Gadus morhua]